MPFSNKRSQQSRSVSHIGLPLTTQNISPQSRSHHSGTGHASQTPHTSATYPQTTPPQRHLDTISAAHTAKDPALFIVHGDFSPKCIADANRRAGDNSASSVTPNGPAA